MNRRAAAISFVILMMAAGCFQKQSTSIVPSSSISGMVASDSNPVGGATVRIQATATETTSDVNGRFRLEYHSAEPNGMTVTASKVGFFIASQSVSASKEIEFELEPLPTHDDPNYRWVDPTPDATAVDNCGNCHAEIFKEWKTGGHASSVGRRFRNLYEGSNWHGDQQVGWSLLDDHPDGAGVCSACHAPSASVDDLALADIRDIVGVPSQGIHCDFCHKIQSVSTENVGLTHGRFGLNLLRPKKGQLFFGPLDDVDRGEDSHLPLQSKSEFCAACHEGVVFGVHVYGTYSEWLKSPAKKKNLQCQSCHMRPSGNMVNFAEGSGGHDRDPMTLASHGMLPGGKAIMLKECLRLRVEMASKDEGVDVSIRLLATNVGHCVPTGFIDRHLILVVDGYDANQQILASSGPRLPAVSGEFAGRNGRLFAKRLLDETETGPIPFWRPASKVIDTRLEPEKPNSQVFAFPKELHVVHVQLIYREFWPSVARQKGWPDDRIVVVDKRVLVERIDE